MATIEGCLICLEDFVSKDIILSTVCGHIFHENCLRKWLNRNQPATCPTCRKFVRNFFRIYLNIKDSTSFSNNGEHSSMIDDSITINLKEQRIQQLRLKNKCLMEKIKYLEDRLNLAEKQPEDVVMIDVGGK